MCDRPPAISHCGRPSGVPSAESGPDSNWTKVARVILNWSPRKDLLAHLLPIVIYERRNRRHSAALAVLSGNIDYMPGIGHFDLCREVGDNRNWRAGLNRPRRSDPIDAAEVIQASAVTARRICGLRGTLRSTEMSCHE